jgi:hypothetical protein
MGVVKVWDPTVTAAEIPHELAARRAVLRGLRVGLLDNGKTNSDKLLADLAEWLAATCGTTTGTVLVKPSISSVAPPEQIAELVRTSDVVIAGVGD